MINLSWEDNGTTLTVELADWTDTLESKGFKAMLEDWVNIVVSGGMEEKVKQRNFSTHVFCDSLVEHIR
ncbi:hypothetical protein [Enterovibrio coralii]|nr:hypothetical protein [Enterovibrio coralii]